MDVRKTIVIFGGSGDVGQTIIKKLLAQECLKNNFNIISLYHKNEIQCSPEVEQIKYDVNSSNDEVMRYLRTQYLSHIYFCVGAAIKSNLVNTSQDEVNRLINTNALSFLNIYKSLFETCRHSKTRFIVISSAAAVKNRATYGAYSASKAILESLVKTLANEEEHYGVTFNILQPYIIDSKLARQTVNINGYKDFNDYVANKLNNKILKLDQVAKVAVEYALNEKYSKINGAVINEFGSAEQN